LSFVAAPDGIIAAWLEYQGCSAPLGGFALDIPAIAAAFVGTGQQ